LDQLVSILIATRNREDALNKLLDSLKQISGEILEIIVIASGRNMQKVINDSDKADKIKYIHSEIENQNYQKYLGIRNVNIKTDWIFFLDDDILIDQNSFKYIIDNYLLKKHNYCGIGLDIKNIKKSGNPHFLMRPVLKTLKLWNKVPGSILASGHAQSYLHSTNICNTEWLNGISIWRQSVIHKYPNLNSVLSYSSYEDVIFSYKVSRDCQLVFDPNAFVVSQNFEDTTAINSTKFLSAAVNRKLFVKQARLSFFYFYLSQMFRSFYYLIKANDESLKSRFLALLHLRKILKSVS
jgi:glycosyltransferase involved in cell wall biosynthesis